MIGPAYKSNFETLSRVIRSNDAALVECTRKSDGATVVMLCAVAFDGQEYQITPFAEMCDGNPFEDYEPPLG